MTLLFYKQNKLDLMFHVLFPDDVEKFENGCQVFLKPQEMQKVHKESFSRVQLSVAYKKYRVWRFRKLRVNRTVINKENPEEACNFYDIQNLRNPITSNMVMMSAQKESVRGQTFFGVIFAKRSPGFEMRPVLILPVLAELFVT